MKFFRRFVDDQFRSTHGCIVDTRIILYGVREKRAGCIMHVIHTLYVHNARVNNDFFSKGIRIFFIFFFGFRPFPTNTTRALRVCPVAGAYVIILLLLLCTCVVQSRYDIIIILPIWWVRRRDAVVV